VNLSGSRGMKTSALDLVKDEAGQDLIGVHVADGVRGAGIRRPVHRRGRKRQKHLGRGQHAAHRS
jgi:hypothetical protein